ncbi:MAG TPA: 3-oxoacyl-ACP reductase FabG [Burkholderiales bacterium]|jgi:3-oxoacyl-[acyl-carrier protein] reductase|nr:3-oxoacyl-ACP reductase FabG [Burkholderiales bacterium]
MIDAEKVKRALVTGGSGAIGAAICRVLAARGLQVIVHANDRLDVAEGLAAELRAGGAKAQAVAFDVTDRSEAAMTLGALVDKAPIQVLVNNAGVHDDVPLAGMLGEQWDRVIGVSLTGFYNVTQPLLLPMIRTRWGRIVNISSVAGVIGNRGQVNYAAAKAGLHGATKSLALELAARGITVNAVAPGIIASPVTEKVFPKEAIEALVPMRRVGEPAEVAALVAFLASDQAAYISGQVISISGGMA